MFRSPEAVISHTVPSGSTRPNRCGSLDGGAATVGAGLPGRGAGRGGPGRGEGLGEEGCPPGSLIVISVPRTLHAVTRAPAAQRGA